LVSIRSERQRPDEILWKVDVMPLLDYMELFEMIQQDSDVEGLRRKATYLLMSKCQEDETVSEEEFMAFAEYAAINLGTIEETIH
jgi:hypothetical protein